ncbi:hypothetical protein GCM10027060_13220 [Nesterenkonia halophila]
MDLSFFWQGWYPITHTAVILIAGYLTLVLILRVSGPRTMTSMTPIDIVVAVTMGSAFGRSITASEVPLSQVVFALVLLVLMQWLFAWVRRRSSRARRLLDAPPVLLYYRGQFQRGAMRSHQVVDDDIYTAARRSGRGDLADVAAVILQQDGSLGVVATGAAGDETTFMPYVGKKDLHRNSG